jgi:hypothetical protein
VQALEPNRPDVLDEIFDGEAVLVNLRTGRYYALDAQATSVWELIVAGESIERAVATLSERLELPASAIEAGVLALLNRLEEELLIRGSAPPAGDAGGSAEFAPSLQVFTDMEDLLLLDPIHEIDVDGSGWPSLGSRA